MLVDVFTTYVAFIRLFLQTWQTPLSQTLLQPKDHIWPRTAQSYRPDFSKNAFGADLFVKVVYPYYNIFQFCSLLQAITAHTQNPLRIFLPLSQRTLARTLFS